MLDLHLPGCRTPSVGSPLQPLSSLSTCQPGPWCGHAHGWDGGYDPPHCLTDSWIPLRQEAGPSAKAARREAQAAFPAAAPAGRSQGSWPSA